MLETIQAFTHTTICATALYDVLSILRPSPVSSDNTNLNSLLWCHYTSMTRKQFVPPPTQFSIIVTVDRHYMELIPPSPVIHRFFRWFVYAVNTIFAVTVGRQQVSVFGALLQPDQS